MLKKAPIEKEKPHNHFNLGIFTIKIVNIKIGKVHVKQAKYVKFLGLLLDENLNWKYRLSEL